MVSKAKVLGDFQTPPSLVSKILEILSKTGLHWTRVLEPTCGAGNFIRGVLQLPTLPNEVVGIEIQPEYILQASKLEAVATLKGVSFQLLEKSIFDVDLGSDIVWQDSGPLLVIGNPPWVTNSEMTALGGDNLPAKSNFKQVNGIEAITGKSNFDISEFIWLKILADLADTSAAVVLLCKTSVARNVLRFAQEAGLPIFSAALYPIDAMYWFDAAVDACLFVVQVGKATNGYRATVYSGLDARFHSHDFGYVDSLFVADVESYKELAYLDGQSPLEWRSGIKHDAANVMELTCSDSTYGNKKGETVNVEDAYIYPYVKSSDVKRLTSGDLSLRYVIVPQTRVGEDTFHLADDAPKLWAYLNLHSNAFAARRSSIYRNRPQFSIFGVGDYSFSEYKVIVSGLYKAPLFVPIGLYGGKPVLCDDTCYLLSVGSAFEAALIAGVLNHPTTERFIDSIVFWDAKRPITKALLQRLDIVALIRSFSDVELFDIVSQWQPHFENSNLPNVVEDLPALLGTIDWLT